MIETNIFQEFLQAKFMAHQVRTEVTNNDL